VRTFGGEIPHVPGTVIKNTCLTVYIELLGYYQIFESMLSLAHVRVLKWSAAYVNVGIHPAQHFQSFGHTHFWYCIHTINGFV